MAKVVPIAWKATVTDSSSLKVMGSDKEKRIIGFILNYPYEFMGRIRSKPNPFGTLGEDKKRKIAEICQCEDYCIQCITLFAVKHPFPKMIYSNKTAAGSTCADSKWKVYILLCAIH